MANTVPFFAHTPAGLTHRGRYPLHPGLKTTLNQYAELSKSAKANFVDQEVVVQIK